MCVLLECNTNAQTEVTHAVYAIGKEIALVGGIAVVGCKVQARSISPRVDAEANLRRYIETPCILGSLENIEVGLQLCVPVSYTHLDVYKRQADGLWLNKSFKNSILQSIARCELDRKRYVYSDLGFVLLQQMVEEIVKLPMDLYLAKEFYAPMGLQRTMFLPLTKFTKAEIMPTAANDYLRRQDLCGYVQDETAACLGGVSGNAGLFSTAEEVAKVYQMCIRDRF